MKKKAVEKIITQKTSRRKLSTAPHIIDFTDSKIRSERLFFRQILDEFYENG